MSLQPNVPVSVKLIFLMSGDDSDINVKAGFVQDSNQRCQTNVLSSSKVQIRVYKQTLVKVEVLIQLVYSSKVIDYRL